MHSSRVRFGPVNPPALTAFRKPIVSGKDVKRHAARYQFTCNRGQYRVASRASRQRDHARIETEVSDSLAKLRPDSVALDEENVRRGAEALVAGHQDAVVRASDPEKNSAGQGRVGDSVGAEQSQPASEAHEHPVNGESGSFIHRDGLYYITDRRIRRYEKYKATV
jgi:hypothetical protein